MADDGDGMASRGHVVARLEKPPAPSLDSEKLEVASGYEVPPEAGFLTTAIHVHRHDAERGGLEEDVVSLPDVQVVRKRETRSPARMEAHDALRIGNGQRSKQQEIQEAEDHGAESDPQGEGHDRGEKEGRPLPESTERVADVQNHHGSSRLERKDTLREHTNGRWNGDTGRRPEPSEDTGHLGSHRAPVRSRGGPHDRGLQLLPRCYPPPPP